MYERRILKYTNRLKVEVREKIYHIKSKHQKVGVAILISDKIDFKTKIIRKGELPKGSIP